MILTVFTSHISSTIVKPLFPEMPKSIIEVWVTNWFCKATIMIVLQTIKSNDSFFSKSELFHQTY